MNFIMVLLSSMIMNIFEIFGYYKVSGEMFSLKNMRLPLVYLLQTSLIIINYIVTPSIFKVLITFSIMSFSCKLLFKNKKLLACILISFIVELLIIISEFVFMLLISLVHQVSNKIIFDIFQGTLIANTIITLIFYIIVKQKIVKVIYEKSLKVVNSISLNQIAIFFGIVILIANLIFYTSSINSSYITLIVNFIVLSIYLLFVIYLIFKQFQYNKISNQYSSTIQELEEYENIINEYRIINHENKNQLQAIQGMTSNKRVNGYIDEILNNKSKKNETILKQALLIPTGGLRGLIYSKLIIMQNKNIEYKLCVDKKITSKLIRPIPSRTILDICQVVGVFIDNAIEEVENLKKRNILINIFLLNKHDIHIEIINNKETLVKVNKIDKVGYTTKKGNHGYGLVLVNRIVKENSALINNRVIKNSIFKQELVIKTQKNS